MRAVDDADVHQRPLRVAVLAKQVPAPDSLQLGPTGRLRRDGVMLEMNAYCRRAVAKGVALARASGGRCTVFTLGPPSANEVLREAVAWGADAGVHLCDPAFAGSDTLATARALAAAISAEGPFDLVLLGRSSLDSGTAQVGPELAALLDVPFAPGVRRLQFAEEVLVLGLELDDAWEEVEVRVPAVLSVAERLCAPCKVAEAGRAAVPVDRIRQVRASELGEGPWGAAGSPTVVGATHALEHRRVPLVLAGDVHVQVDAALHHLAARGALDPPVDRPVQLPASPDPASPARCGEALGAPSRFLAPAVPEGGTVAVLVDPRRPQLAAELLGAAARLSGSFGAAVVAFVAPATGHSPDARALAVDLGAFGADHVRTVVPAPPHARLGAEDVARALADWAVTNAPRLILAPGTAVGCEVAARVAATLGAGLIGDAVSIDIADGVLVAAKPAFAGSLLAEITCTSAVQLVTVRPGVLDVRGAAAKVADVSTVAVRPRGRVTSRSVRRDDDVDALARARVVIGLGHGVDPGEYADVNELAKVLGAEVVGTRKVTDAGWLPRSRQVGITGWSIAPHLYVAIGISGSLNHTLGVRSAGTVLAINIDASAPVFQIADVGIVGDWRETVPLLTSRLREKHLARTAAMSTSAGLERSLNGH